MKELKPSGLFTVAIPLESHNIQDTKADGIMWQMPDGSWDSFYFEDEIKAPYEIIGSVTAEHIDFDVEPYTNATGFQGREIFLQMLKANDVHFVNPYERPNVEDDEDNAMARVLLNQWQQAESKLVDKILILKPL